MDDPGTASAIAAAHAQVLAARRFAMCTLLPTRRFYGGSP
jgi:hypothetical protein